MAHLFRLSALLCAALSGACASNIVVSSASGMPKANLGVLEVSENRWAKLNAAITQVRDSTGKQLVSLAPARGGAGTTIHLIPGRYEVTMNCSLNGLILAAANPTAKLAIEAGITYSFDCRLEDFVAYPVITSRPH